MSPSRTRPRPSEDRRRVLIFLAIAFGLAGSTALVLYATGGILGSRPLLPGTSVTVAVVLLPTVYMFSPAIAHVLTRVVTREGWTGLRLRPYVDRGRRLIWFVAWSLPAVLAAAGALLYFVSHPGSFDPTLTAVRDQLAATEQQVGQPIPLPPGAFLALQLSAAVLLAPLLNTTVAFGEEFGWRAYLLPKLIGLTGVRPGIVLTGFIWGCWHWPLIALGYEYGVSYRGAPWLGFLLFCWFTVAVGTFLAWLTMRSGSIWPAALAHGALNASAGAPGLFLLGPPDLLVGPLPIGVLSSLPWVLTAIVLLLRVARDPGRAG